jgi:hypothetical protein
VVGEPIYFTEQDLEPAGKDLYQRLSQRVMDAIAALRLE